MGVYEGFRVCFRVLGGFRGFRFVYGFRRWVFAASGAQEVLGVACALQRLFGRVFAYFKGSSGSGGALKRGFFSFRAFECSGFPGWGFNPKP